MFFSISQHNQSNFPVQYQVGKFVVNTDTGWTQASVGNKTVVYKGYADQFDLSKNLELVLAQTEPMILGNFCAIVSSGDAIEIKSDRYRSFPIYINDNCVNNLIPTEHTAWTDSLVTIHPDFSIVEDKFDIIGPIDTTPLTYQNVVEKIIEKINTKTQSFLAHNTLPIKAFLSGGVDSLLVYSFLKKHTNNFELVRGNYVDWDYFWIKNSNDIMSHWGYTQIHHWINDCVLTSGAPGDEFMLRSPVTADLYLKYHGANIIDLIQSPAWSNCLHREYFLKDKHLHIFKTQQAPNGSLEQLHWDLCNIVINDWQHWHLGKTLTWTPLRDLEIFKLMLRLPLEDATAQSLNSKLSVDIIEHNCPGLSRAISTQKNTGNELANLADFVL
jgi:hypothetical protein